MGGVGQAKLSKIVFCQVKSHPSLLVMPLCKLLMFCKQILSQNTPHCCKKRGYVVVFCTEATVILLLHVKAEQYYVAVF